MARIGLLRAAPGSCAFSWALGCFEVCFGFRASETDVELLVLLLVVTTSADDSDYDRIC